MAVIESGVLSTEWTLDDLREHLGGIPLDRIYLFPFPGTATDEDVLRAKSRLGRICERIDGVLVAKTMGYFESRVAAVLIHLIETFLDRRNLGIVLGEAGMLRILPEQVRIPDLCFIAWERFPGGKLPQEPIPTLVPDLAVEVLSPGNTEREMRRKLEEYFAAGTRLVWYIDPRARSAQVYHSAEDRVEVPAAGVLDGDQVLPGFRLPLAELFTRAEGGPR